jgi:hypothetical protein
MTFEVRRKVAQSFALVLVGERCFADTIRIVGFVFGPGREGRTETVHRDVAIA